MFLSKYAHINLTCPLVHPELLESGRCSKPPHPQDITPEKISMENQDGALVRRKCRIRRGLAYPIHLLEEITLFEVMYCSSSYHKLEKVKIIIPADLINHMVFQPFSRKGKG